MSVKKTIVLGVTGSIAAHKAVDIASQLTKAGHDIHVVMTADAQRFITPLPFKTLSRNPVVTDLYDEEEGWKPTHITLADAASLLLIAPATANVMAKLAHGIADDALTCIALALNAQARVLVAPAMNGKMWQHPATQQNLATLKSRGADIVGPDAGNGNLLDTISIDATNPYNPFAASAPSVRVAGGRAAVPVAPGDATPERPSGFGCRLCVAGFGCLLWFEATVSSSAPGWRAAGRCGCGP